MVRLAWFALACSALLSLAHAKELTMASWAAETKGKQVFVKFLAPWCGHCKKMKPDWDKLMKEYEGSESAGVYDVDCTKAGQSLCTKAGVRGYPTIMFGDPSDVQQLEKYKGPRTLEGLSKFAKENLHGGGKPKPGAKGSGKVRDSSKGPPKKGGPFGGAKPKEKKKKRGPFGSVKPSSLFDAQREKKQRTQQSIRDHHRRMDVERREKQKQIRDHHEKQRWGGKGGKRHGPPQPQEL